MTVAAAVAALLYLVDLAIKIAAIGVIPGNRKPSSAMAWLILILIIPFAGFAIFLVLGRTSLGRKRLERQTRADAAVRAAFPDVAPPPGPVGEHIEGVFTLAHALGSLPPKGGNTLSFCRDYSQSIEAMAAAIREARATVEVEFYISAWDETTSVVFEAMADAAERGVSVRFLFDHIGSRGIPGYREFIRRLEGTGIEWYPMLPIRPLKGQLRRPDLRNHRKILVVDGAVAFMGSLNLIDPTYNKPKNQAAGRRWLELVCRVEGPAVDSLRAVFAKDWYIESGGVPRELATPGAVLPAKPATAVVASPTPVSDVTCQVIPSGPGYNVENNLRVFTTLIYGARRRLSITSPYFVPDESLLYAVTNAARRGVAVELFVSAEGDQFMVHHAQRSYYQALLEAGVEIWLYPAPTVLHSKHFSVDDDLAVIGSSNMDMRSFDLNYEVSMLMVGAPVVAEMRSVEDGYRAVSRRLTLEEWNARGRGARYVDNAMRLTAALQ